MGSKWILSCKIVILFQKCNSIICSSLLPYLHRTIAFSTHETVIFEAFKFQSSSHLEHFCTLFCNSYFGYLVLVFILSWLIIAEWQKKTHNRCIKIECATHKFLEWKIKHINKMKHAIRKKIIIFIIRAYSEEDELSDRFYAA